MTTARTPSPRARGIARELRRRATEPERRLWWHLRHRLPLEGSHFRRQVPIGRFVVDFCCLKAKLVVEVDGNQHGLAPNEQRDRERTALLQTDGFRVLRFSNRDVMTEIDVVLDTIFAALNLAPPTPAPPREGEGIASRST